MACDRRGGKTPDIPGTSVQEDKVIESRCSGSDQLPSPMNCAAAGKSWSLTRFMMKYSSMERYTMKKTQDQGFRE